MKKVLVSILALTMALGLSACGNSGGAGTGGEPQGSAGGEEASGESGGAQAVSEGGEAADGSWSYIEGKGELVIGITYFEPMNYLDEGGNLTGFETEFATEVCKILGVEPKFQEISWSAKETELNSKTIDCIWNGMTIDEERAQNMNISRPYMQNKQVLVVKSAGAAAMAESVDGLTVVAEAGSAGETVAQGEAFFSGASYTPVDSQSKALMEVASGTADACVVDYVLSIGMIGEGTDYADLVAVEGGFGEEEYGIAVRKGDDELMAKVNDAISQLIENGTLMEIAEKYKLGDVLITD